MPWLYSLGSIYNWTWFFVTPVDIRFTVTRVRVKLSVVWFQFRRCEYLKPPCLPCSVAENRRCSKYCLAYKHERETHRLASLRLCRLFCKMGETCNHNQNEKDFASGVKYYLFFSWFYLRGGGGGGNSLNYKSDKYLGIFVTGISYEATYFGKQIFF